MVTGAADQCRQRVSDGPSCEAQGTSQASDRDLSGGVKGQGQGKAPQHEGGVGNVEELRERRGNQPGYAHEDEPGRQRH